MINHEIKLIEPGQPLEFFFREAGMRPVEVADTELVVKLLRGNGYDVNVPMMLEWCRAGLNGPMTMSGGQFQWNLGNIATALTRLEHTRQWILWSPRHLSKMNAMELSEQIARLDGTTIFPDLDDYDVNTLLEIVVRATNVEARRTASIALKTKLEKAAS